MCLSNKATYSSKKEYFMSHRLKLCLFLQLCKSFLESNHHYFYILLTPSYQSLALKVEYCVTYFWSKRWSRFLNIDSQPWQARYFLFDTSVSHHFDIRIFVPTTAQDCLGQVREILRSEIVGWSHGLLFQDRGDFDLASFWRHDDVDGCHFSSAGILDLRGWGRGRTKYLRIQAWGQRWLPRLFVFSFRTRSRELRKPWPVWWDWNIWIRMRANKDLDTYIFCPSWVATEIKDTGKLEPIADPQMASLGGAH